MIKQNPNQIEAVLDVEDDDEIELNCQDHHSTGKVAKVFTKWHLIGRLQKK